MTNSYFIRYKTLPFLISILLLISFDLSATTGDPVWMTKGKYGIFMHYQFRILPGYGGPTKPLYPDESSIVRAGISRYFLPV